MRIDIRTNGKRVTDRDIRCLYIMIAALDNSSPRMVHANLEYVADRLGYFLVAKGNKFKEKP